MDKETRKALEASIAHWYRISACMTPAELGCEGYHAKDCPLCNRFILNDCTGCPVAKKSKDWLCYQTPYYQATRSLDHWCLTFEWTEHDQENIKAEIRFLESLL